MRKVDGVILRPLRELSLPSLTRSLGSRTYYGGTGESWPYLSDLDPRLLSHLASGDKDYEAVDFGHSVAPSARLADGDVVFLANLYRLGPFRPKASTGARSPVTASASETRYFISQCLDGTGLPRKYTL